MSLWRRMRAELAGALRSMRYDLRGRPAEQPDGPDVTSTGLSTFPGALMEWRTAAPETDARPPRRFVAVTALCLLALVGAIGSYLLVTKGLAAADDRPVAAPVEPAAPTPAETAGPSPAGPAEPTSRTDDRIGPVTGAKAVQPGPVGTTAGAPPVATKNDISETHQQKPSTHRPPATTPECDCAAPPVPTPTIASPGDGTSPDPHGSTSGSPSAAPSGSTDPSPDASSGDTDGERRHGRRHWQKNG